MNLHDCLPAEFADATITRITGGFSGASVHRVDHDGRAFVLKLGDEQEPIERWRTRRDVQRAAAAAGVTPAVIHSDERHRAVVTAFVADQSFALRYREPATRDATIVQLGELLRRVHDVPMPAGLEQRDLRDFLRGVRGALDGFAVPPFVGAAIDRGLAETPPPRERELVLSHNDVNPTNLVHDGARLMLLDWDAAGANDPLYDLAAIAAFLRMDDATCLALLAAHDGAPAAELPAVFRYLRRMVATLCGALFLTFARKLGHPGDAAAEAPSFVEYVQRVRAGLDPRTPDGAWAFGLSLVGASR